jgi:hydrogenase nickel incorporation protein HypA/HybF
MHELSIATSIIEIAEDFAREKHVEKIRKIEVEVGKLSGVVCDNLIFALDIAVKDTVLDGAEIIIDETEGRSVCNPCGTEFVNNDWYTPCPGCQSLDFEITAGKELRVRSIFFD